jgi:sterol desaturase/sphingolipid hydroxylase (fatty acid hydroxylase superfamily)
MDVYYYWCHRFLHLRLPYRYIHKMHHRVHVPYCSAGFYLHPAEVLLLDQGAAFVASTLFPSMRFWTVLILQLLLPIRACHEHLGYVFPWDVDNSALGTQKVTHHGIHHQPAGHKFNYSTPFFTFLVRAESSMHLNNAA